MRDGVSGAGSKREIIKRLWKSYFADPSQWWDYRLFKTNPKAPDFQHKTTREKLFLDATRKPNWVIRLLEKRDRQHPPSTFPTQMLEKQTKEDTVVSHHIKPIITRENSEPRQTKKVPAYSKEESNLKQNKKRQTLDSRDSFGVLPVVTRKDPNSKQEEKMRVNVVEDGLKQSFNLGTYAGRTTREVQNLKQRKRMPAVSIEGPDLKQERMLAATSIEESDSGSSPCILSVTAIEGPNWKQEKKMSSSFMEEHNLKQDKKVSPSYMEIDQPNLKQKQIANSGAPPFGAGTHAVQTRTSKKSYIIGAVCDWNALSVEDSIHALEKGLFSEPSVGTLEHIVGRSTRKKDRDYALRLLAYLQQNGLDCHEMLAEGVISMLVEVGSMPQARVIFDKMTSRRSRPWNALIKGHADCGESQQAIDLFKRMRGEHGLHLHGHTTVLLLKACTVLKDVKVGCLVHTDAAREGLLKRNPCVGNALLDMYMKCGFLGEAQDLFDSLPTQNVVTWTTLIAGYAQHNHGVAALEGFHLMLEAGVAPNEYTISSVLKACASLKNSTVGMEVHRKVEQEGLLKTSQIVGNAVIDMYAKCGLLTKAQEVFDLLPAQDVISWNALITGYTDHAYFNEAIMCFERMQAGGVPPNGFTFACCLKACANTRAIEKGREIHLAIKGRGFLDDPILGSSLIDMYAKCGLLRKAKAVFDKLPVQDTITWTSLMAGYVQHDAFEKALVCFKQMRAKGVSPDAVAYACGLKACSSVGATKIGIKLHEEIAGRCMLGGEQLLGNAVIDMYTKFGMLAVAHEVFEALQIHDVVSWTALLTGHAQLGDIEKVFIIFDRMRGEGINPTSITMVSTLHACSNAGMVDVAIRCLEAMSEDYGIIPSLQHHACVVDLLGRIGTVDQAVAQVLTFPFHPNAVMWLAVLGACQRWGHVKLAKAAFEQVMLLDESVTSSYICMSNVCVGADMLEEAMKMEVVDV